MRGAIGLDGAQRRRVKCGGIRILGSRLERTCEAWRIMDEGKTMADRVEGLAAEWLSPKEFLHDA